MQASQVSQQQMKGELASVAYWLPRCAVWLAAGLAALPLVLDLKLGVSMASIAPITWPLSVLLLAAAVLIARQRESELVRVLIIGVLAGAIATSAYDASRLASLSAGIGEMDEAFGFGQRLTRQIPAGAMNDAMAGETSTPHDAMAQDTHSGHVPRGLVTLVGYLWHYWNGAMFSLAFLLVFGLRRWWYPVLGMVLILYPAMALVMGFHSVGNVVLEVAGHAAYGAVLGIVCWRYLGAFGGGWSAR